MQRKVKKPLALILTLCVVLAMALPVYAADDDVFEVDGNYTGDLIAALTHAANGSSKTIRLLDDHTHYGTVEINAGHGVVTFDLNGYTLNIDGGAGPGLRVASGGGLLLADPDNGKLNITGASGLETINAIAEVTNVTAASPSGFGVKAMNDSRVTVHGKITAPGTYIFVNDIPQAKSDGIPSSIKPGYLEYTAGGATVLVNDKYVCEIAGAGAQYLSVTDAIEAVPDGGSATIILLTDIDHSGQVTVDNKIITFELDGKTLNAADPSTVTVGCGLLARNNGEINISGAGALNAAGYDGVKAESGGRITVTNVTSTGSVGYGVDVSDPGSQVTVKGSITATSSNSCGVYADNSGKVIVDGTINVPPAAIYIMVGGIAKTPGGYTEPTTMPGYLTYAYGTTAVWVKNNACKIMETGAQYDNISDAVNAVSPGGAATIKLLMDVGHSGQVTVDNKIITFDLDGKTLNVVNPSTASGSYGLLVSNNGEVNITGAGALNVTGFSGARVEGGSKAALTNVTASGSSGIGLFAGGSGTQVTVNGDVTATGSSGCGVHADSAGKVTVDGSVNVPAGAAYIQTGTAVKTKGDYIVSSSLPGYFEYTDGINTVWVNNRNICQNVDTGVQYMSLPEALNAVPSGGTATIKILKDIDHSGQITIDNKKITFNLDGTSLNIVNPSTVMGNYGLLVRRNGEVHITGGGALNITGYNGAGADSGGQVTVTNAAATGSFGDGVYASGFGSQVTVKGNVTSSGNYGEGVYASGSTSQVNVNGNITATGSASYGVYATDGGQVTVTGNITAGNTGVFAANGSQATVNGNITAAGAYGFGVNAYSSSMVTVNGMINVLPTATYICFDTIYMSSEDHLPGSSKPDYLEYASGTSKVWVKIDSGPPDILYGDVNGDGVVDMYDLSYLAMHLNKYPGYETVGPGADVNGDGNVDMYDLSYLAMHLNKYPGYEILGP